MGAPMNKAFVQDAAYAGHAILRTAHQWLTKWWNLVQEGRNPDPEVVAAQLDHTADKLREHARIIRAEVAKRREAA
jgi:hypothetical protein